MARTKTTGKALADEGGPAPLIGPSNPPPTSAHDGHTASESASATGDNGSNPRGAPRAEETRHTRAHPTSVVVVPEGTILPYQEILDLVRAQGERMASLEQELERRRRHEERRHRDYVAADEVERKLRRRDERIRELEERLREAEQARSERTQSQQRGFDGEERNQGGPRCSEDDDPTFRPGASRLPSTYHQGSAYRRYDNPSPVVTYDDPDTPFTDDIMSYPVPPNFRAPTDIRQYDGTTDPQEHLDIYRTRMLLDGTADPIRCKAFPLTLAKSALTWFNQLPTRSIQRFSDLSSRFLAQFTTSRTKVKSVTSLLGFRQLAGESLRGYLDRFNQEALKVRDLTPQTALMTLIGGLKSGDFQRSLAKREP